MLAEVARDLTVVARHIQIDSDDLLGNGMLTAEIRRAVVGQSRPDRLGGRAEHHGGPPLLGNELLCGVIGLVQQRDPQVLTRRPGAVCLDDGLERLTGHDWPVQQQLVLAMDTAARVQQTQIRARTARSPRPGAV